MSKEEIISGIIISIAFVSLIVLFCILLIQLYVKKIKDHNLKELEFQQTLNQAIVETHEHALKNFSQDLHDDAGQQLTYINFQLENLKLDSPEMDEVLTPVSKSVEHLSKSIRDISHSLNNQVILQKDLIKTIEADIKRLKKNKKIAIEFSFDRQADKKFSDTERIFIYRIFQECVSNCLKHASCKEINVWIKTAPHFQMVFSDNGSGFAIDANARTVSMGLMNMKVRAEAINYKLTIDSAIGMGTTVTLKENKRD